MNTKYAMRTICAIGGVLLLASSAMAEDKGVDWKQLEGAKVTLAKGLDAAQAKGKPISGKYEAEDGKLQLSVYTVTKGKYHEVIVDHVTGKVTKDEEIKDGEDLQHATAEEKAMTGGKQKLSAVVAKAEKANQGYRAVSATPAMEGGKPVVTIVLENATGTKTVSENLK